MDDAFFAENSLVEVNVPEDPNLDIEAALGAPEPDTEENVTSLVPSIHQRTTLYFGEPGPVHSELNLLLITRSQMRQYRYT